MLVTEFGDRILWQDFSEIASEKSHFDKRYKGMAKADKVRNCLTDEDSFGFLHAIFTVDNPSLTS